MRQQVVPLGTGDGLIARIIAIPSATTRRAARGASKSRHRTSTAATTARSAGRQHEPPTPALCPVRQAPGWRPRSRAGAREKIMSEGRSPGGAHRPSQERAMIMDLSDFNHWCCSECLRTRPERKQKLRPISLSVGTLLPCCLCARESSLGVIVREHPKAPSLKGCKGIHKGPRYEYG